ncbi:MAG: Linearmycin resistance ATP-binding protein LnrL [Desulfovibrio sp.]
MLRLFGIGKTHGGRTVLHDLSLHVAPGTFTLVTGPNGAGKSTLLHIMAGLSRPDSGRVERNVPPGKTGFLGHETFLYPNLTALENLAFWCSLHGARKKETALLDALDAMHLAPFADDMAGGFSRGMAQRLSLARLLLLGPSLVLLDEPLTGLDVDSATLVRAKLLRLQENGAALVWVSHDPEHDGRAADMIVHLDIGGAYSVTYTPAQAEAAPC